MGLLKRTASLRPLRPRARHARLRARALALVGLLSAIAALSATSAPAASAVEPGVVLAAPTASRSRPSRRSARTGCGSSPRGPTSSPQRGVFAANWLASYEGLFHSLPAGTKVIVDVVGTPSGRRARATNTRRPRTPRTTRRSSAPSRSAGPGGSRRIEIWNEEDNASWWAGAPNPAAYAELLKATYPVVKAADPGATVVLGGLTGNDYPFLEGVYAAGGKGSFDAVGVHTDTACNISPPASSSREHERAHDPGLVPGVPRSPRRDARQRRRQADLDDRDELAHDRRDLRRRRLRRAEAGGRQRSDSRRAYLAQAYHCMAQDPYVQVALWFPLQDEGAAVSGLIRANGSRKPSFAAMQDYVASRRPADRIVRRLQRPADRRIQAGEPHDLQRRPADPRLRARQPGRRAHHAGDQRQADPQLHQPGLPDDARRRTALARRGAHPLRTPTA